VGPAGALVRRLPKRDSKGDRSFRPAEGAQRTIDPGKLTIVVVGNGSALREDLGRIAPVQSAPAP